MLVPQVNLDYEIEDLCVLDFGTFYFFKDFVISEINEEVHINWTLAKKAIDQIINHYGLNRKIALISNRHYSYSLDPHYWDKFFSKYNFINAYALVSYNGFECSHMAIENLFFKSNIKGFSNLNDAIDWSLQMRLVLNENNS